MRGVGGQLESWLTEIRGGAIRALVSERASSGAPAVVLLHGLIASGRYMLPTAELLARTHRVYVPDLPGYGSSYKPFSALPIPSLANALLAWMDTLELDRVILLGNSFGCQVAVDLAVRFPQRAERLILVGPTGDPHARSVLLQAARLALDGLREPSSLWLVLLRDLLDLGIRRAIGSTDAMLADHIEEKLPHVAVPSLVVRGDRDPVVPQRWAEEVVGLLPRGQLAVIPGAAHAANYSEPLKLAHLVETFLS